MNKKFLLFFLAVGISILYLFNVERLISKKITSLNSYIKLEYINIMINLNEIINKYFDQLNYIEQLKISNKKNLHYKFLYEQKLNELVELKQNIKIDTIKDKAYKRVRVVSYYKFNNYSQIILDQDIDPNNKISALITYDGYSAGIVLNKQNQSVAYLNEHKKCNYTVFIGKSKIPGITSGVNKKGNMLIKYIPIWKTVKLNDEVITSNMDSIFPYGIKVGKVIKINLYENEKEVLVAPYAHTLGIRYYYVYTDQKNR